MALSTEDRLDSLEQKMKRTERKFAVIEGKEWTKQECGTCGHPYWCEEDIEGICRHTHSESVRRVQSACEYWRAQGQDYIGA